MAALCGGRVVFVVVLCMTLMGLANCATVAPAAPAATTVAAGNDSVAAPVAPTVAAAPMTVAAGNDSTGVESNTTTVPAIVESNTTTAPAVMVTTAPKTIQEQLDEMSEKLKSMITRCKVCFRETEGSTQCQGARETCSGWSSPGMSANETVWSDEFRDDTDNRGGGCKYQWRLMCE